MTGATLLSTQREALETVRPWTELPDAAAILADMAANPPKQRTMPYEGLTLYHAPFFVGKRVQRLYKIHAAERERVLLECDARGDHGAFKALCALDVQTAISDIINSAERFRALGASKRRAA